MSYVIGVDIGGTFTDCIGIDTDMEGASANSVDVRIGKAPSTPPDFQTGFVDSLRSAAASFEVDVDKFIGNAQGIYHGCTVGTNALVEGRTAKVGLLASRGHSDSIFIMQAGARLKWMPAEYIAHVAAQTKPKPLVPKNLCEEVDERVAFDGNVVVELNENGARKAIQRLIDEGVDAFAISLLWSTVNDVHEKRLRELVQEMAPNAFVSVSSEVIARTGEYERTIATIMNALIGPPMESYLQQLESDLGSLGYRGSLQIMSCSGGLIDSATARRLPVLTIGSGPAAGLVGASNLAKSAASSVEDNNIITCDMGGTTLDVGLIVDGAAISRPTASYGQYEYFVPTLDVRSVGDGGGSIIVSDGETLHVGPESAGARPGPACFGKGGIEATVTDANLMLGYLNPDYFLAGRMSLDIDAARKALAEAGKPLGFDAEQTAAAAARIVDNQMADAIRLTTIQQGCDARNFTIYAYGGGGPVQASPIAREVGVKKVVVPLSNFAAGWSAFGVAASDALVVDESAVAMTYPFDPDVMNAQWKVLEKNVTERLLSQGISRDQISIDRYADMRYAVQINQIQVAAPNIPEYTSQTVDELIEVFEGEYERYFGKGSGYAGAGYALNALRVRASAPLSDLRFDAVDSRSAAGDISPKGYRDVIWYTRGVNSETTPVYDGLTLGTGNQLDGPAIVEYPDTTIVLWHGDHAHLDEIGCVVISIGGSGS